MCFLCQGNKQQLGERQKPVVKDVMYYIKMENKGLKI